MTCAKEEKDTQANIGHNAVVKAIRICEARYLGTIWRKTRRTNVSQWFCKEVHTLNIG
jgi:hypothetical protein